MAIYEHRDGLGSILDRVVGGEEIVITRHEKVVAGIIPDGRASRENIRDAVAGLRALRSKIAKRGIQASSRRGNKGGN